MKSARRASKPTNKAGLRHLLPTHRAGTPKGVGPVQSGDEICAGLGVPGRPGPVTELLLQVRDRQGGYHFVP